MSSSNGILQAGTLVANKLAATGIFLDDSSAPSLNVAHQWQAGVINLSAGLNPQQGFSVTPVAQGNTQTFQGPNIVAANSLQAPGTVTLGAANVTTSLQVTGPSTLTGNTTITGSFLATGPSTFGNTLQVANVLTVPTIKANTVSLTGTASNLYVETTSSLSSNTSAFYLSPTWRVKVIQNGALATQYLLAGSWTNVQVLAPPNLAISIANLTAPTT